METESDYLITNPNLVSGYLKDIIRNRCLITAHFGDGNHSYMTCIVSVDSKKKLLEIDSAPSESLNAKLLSSPEVVFRTVFDGIEVSFTGQGIKQIKKGSGSSFLMRLPDSIFWMQRRQCYRMKIPERLANCTIEFLANAQHKDAIANHIMSKLIRFNLVDISISGFAFHNVVPDLADYLLPAVKLHNCLLRLDDKQDNGTRVSCQIMNINQVRAPQSVVTQRIGCRFIEFPVGFDAVLWRYVQNLELEQRKR